MAAVACAALIAASPALADTIEAVFKFVPTGTLTADTGDVTTANTITSGVPELITSIITNNIDLSASTTIISLTSPTPVTMGATFMKVFDTAFGEFTENLTVTSVSPGTSSLGITASGTITETTYKSGPTFDPTPVLYSAAYTQTGDLINASFTDATVPGPILGAGLPGLLAACSAMIVLARRRRHQAA
jgi:hypothetical protein